MNRGYVKLWRKIEDSAVFADPHLLQLFVWCLMRATHKVYSVPARTGRGQTVVTLQPGQFIFGRHAAAKALKCKGSTIQYRMETLKRSQMIVIHPVTHYSIVTVVNWASYQEGVEDVRQPTRHPLRHPSVTYKNEKNKERSTAAPAKDAGPPSENEKILGYDTVGRPLYAPPKASEAAR